MKGLTQDDADKLNAGGRWNSTEKDPPLSADTHFAAGQLKESQDQDKRLRTVIAEYQAKLDRRRPISSPRASA